MNIDMNMSTSRQLYKDMTKEQKKEAIKEYETSKIAYYRKLLIWIVAISAMSEVAYFVSDCMLFQKFAWPTFIPRFCIIIPLSVFLFVFTRTTKYDRFLSLATYIMAHIAMWCTIWAIWYLPTKDFAREGFIIMHFMFLAIGYCTPRKSEFVAHALVLVNILISNIWNHYDFIWMSMALAVPIFFAIEFALWMGDKAYRVIYDNSKNAEFMSIHDQLTGAFNRVKMKHLCVESSGLLVFRKASVLILDLDYFKRINDTYGHSVGDEVLIELVKVIKNCVRDVDYIIRWGGEEFVVILPDADEASAGIVAERIRSTIDAHKEFVTHVTVSVGVAYATNRDFNNAVKEADKALYYAKDSGRNKVVLASET